MQKGISNDPTKRLNEVVGVHRLDICMVKNLSVMINHLDSLRMMAELRWLTEMGARATDLLRLSSSAVADWQIVMPRYFLRCAVIQSNRIFLKHQLGNKLQLKRSYKKI